MGDITTGGMTAASIRHAILSISDTMEAQYQELNALDGKIGDGDLGITLLKAFRELRRNMDALPDDVGQALVRCGGDVANVSSSSFGTLLVTGCLSASQAFKGADVADWADLPAVLAKVVDALMARGKAKLGDKTVVDALHAVAEATAGETDPAALLGTARDAIDRTLDEFRGKPAQLGRARMFGERTIGMDDPGMVALRLMVGSLADGD